MIYDRIALNSLKAIESQCYRIVLAVIHDAVKTLKRPVMSSEVDIILKALESENLELTKVPGYGVFCTGLLNLDIGRIHALVFDLYAKGFLLIDSPKVGFVLSGPGRKFVLDEK